MKRGNEDGDSPSAKRFQALPMEARTKFIEKLKSEDVVLLTREMLSAKASASNMEGLLLLFLQLRQHAASSSSDAVKTETEALSSAINELDLLISQPGVPWWSELTTSLLALVEKLLDFGSPSSIKTATARCLYHLIKPTTTNDLHGSSALSPASFISLVVNSPLLDQLSVM